MSFKKLKSMSGKKSLESLTSEINKISGKEGEKEKDNFWKPTVDKAGNGYAVIRFLPPVDGEEVPFVRIFDHGFQGPTGLWYIENSLTTIGKTDPVSEYNGKLWNSTSDDDSPERKQARKQKRRLHYISNIYVITDQGNPENEGKVFLYKYGKKIFDKLNETMNPQFEDENPINPFDLWEGANFKLKIRQVDGYRNYDKSEFGKQEPLFDDDAKLEDIWKQEYPLQPFLSSTNFKTYDELKARLMKVLDEKTPTVNKAEKQNLEDNETPPPSLKSKAPVNLDEDDDDDSLEFFKKLSQAS